MPTISCPAQVLRSRRARKIALSSAPPHFIRGRRLSPIAKRNGWRCAVRISERCSVRMCVLAVAIGLRLQFLHRVAHFERRRGRRHRLAETHRDGIGNRARQFPDEAPALEAENAAPHAVEIHGNDRRVHALHDALHAAAEGEQLADARDLPLSENADDFAVLDRVGGFAQAIEAFRAAAARRKSGSRESFSRTASRTADRRCL